MGKVVGIHNSVVLHGVKVDLDSSTGQQFTADCCRAGEGLCSDDDVRSKWEITDAEWVKIANNKTFHQD